MSDNLQIAEWLTVDNLLSSGASFLEPIVGIANCAIAFDFDYQRFSVEIPVTTVDLPKAQPRSLKFKVALINGLQKLVVSCDSKELFRSFYDFIHEVLELVHSGDYSPKEAVEVSWLTWGQLIERESSLSREKQIGLLGELWLLERLASFQSWEFALDAWHKTSVSEHDFCLPKKDIEVKTCTGEARSHLIGSLTQLQPSADRDLYLLSVQLTSASIMATESFSLASKVRIVEEAIGTDKESLSLFRLRLESTGWNDDHTDYYDANFILRSKSRLVRVDDDCPSIVEATLSGLSGAMRSRISSVGYRIDVTSLGVEDGQDNFAEILMS